MSNSIYESHCDFLKSLNRYRENHFDEERNQEGTRQKGRRKEDRYKEKVAASRRCQNAIAVEGPGNGAFFIGIYGAL
jgi:hypothetical protein